MGVVLAALVAEIVLEGLEIFIYCMAVVGLSLQLIPVGIVVVGNGVVK